MIIHSIIDTVLLCVGLYWLFKPEAFYRLCAKIDGAITVEVTKCKRPTAKFLTALTVCR